MRLCWYFHYIFVGLNNMLYAMYSLTFMDFSIDIGQDMSSTSTMPFRLFLQFSYCSVNAAFLGRCTHSFCCFVVPTQLYGALCIWFVLCSKSEVFPNNRWWSASRDNLLRQIQFKYAHMHCSYSATTVTSR